jgi:hypothetical protein
VQRGGAASEVLGKRQAAECCWRARSPRCVFHSTVQPAGSSQQAAASPCPSPSTAHLKLVQGLVPVLGVGHGAGAHGQAGHWHGAVLLVPQHRALVHVQQGHLQARQEQAVRRSQPLHAPRCWCCAEGCAESCAECCAGGATHPSRSVAGGQQPVRAAVGQAGDGRWVHGAAHAQLEARRLRDHDHVGGRARAEAVKDGAAAAACPAHELAHAHLAALVACRRRAQCRGRGGGWRSLPWWPHVVAGPGSVRSVLALACRPPVKSSECSQASSSAVTALGSGSACATAGLGTWPSSCGTWQCKSHSRTLPSWWPAYRKGHQPQLVVLAAPATHAAQPQLRAVAAAAAAAAQQRRIRRGRPPPSPPARGAHLRGRPAPPRRPR